MSLLRGRKEFDDNHPVHSLWGRPELCHLGQGIERGLIEQQAAGGIHQPVLQHPTLLIEHQLTQHGVFQIVRQRRRLLLHLNRCGQDIRVAGEAAPAFADRLSRTATQAYPTLLEERRRFGRLEACGELIQSQRPRSMKEIKTPEMCLAHIVGSAASDD